ncbi:hypothetical protein GCM10010360_73470 [Streptomyces nogalater]
MTRPRAWGAVTAAAGEGGAFAFGGTRAPVRPQPPVVTVRSADQPPQVPSGSRARSRTRCSSPAAVPA